MRILFLAGSSDQIPFIKKLRKIGHKIILVDFLEKPLAEKYADKFVKLSTLDIPNVKKLAIKEKIDLITTACTDQALLTMAKVSEDLNLPCYLSYKKALNLTQKHKMKTILTNNNVPTSKYIFLSNKRNLEKINFLKFPLVIKPVDANSSKGVIKIYKKSEIKQGIKKASQFSRSNSVIIEEFKKGKEFSVDVYIDHGIAKVLAITTSNKIQNKNSFVIFQSFYPVNILKKMENEIQQISQKIAESSSLDNCPMIIQFILSKSKLYVLEFSARIAGGSKCELIKTISGVDMKKVFIDRILGKNPRISPQKTKKFIKMNFVYCNSGIFKKLENFNKMKKNGLIEHFFKYKKEGSFINFPSSSSDRVAGFLVSANERRELLEKMKKINSNVAVLNDKGEDIMIHELYDG